MTEDRPHIPLPSEEQIEKYLQQRAVEKADAYYHALHWYRQGMEDAHNDGVIAPGHVAKYFYEHYAKEIPDVIDCQGVGWQERYEFKLPDGKKIAVGRLSTDFFEKIRALPTPTKLEMMNISIQELDEHVKAEKTKLIDTLEIIFKSKWVDIYESQPIDWMDAKANNDRFELPYTSKALLAHFRAGRLNVLSFADTIFRFVKDECKSATTKRSVEHSKVLGALGLI